jgi:hypothetical protein
MSHYGERLRAAQETMNRASCISESRLLGIMEAR